jgi:hypothetical protein
VEKALERDFNMRLKKRPLGSLVVLAFSLAIDIYDLLLKVEVWVN